MPSYSLVNEPTECPTWALEACCARNLRGIPPPSHLAAVGSAQARFADSSQPNCHQQHSERVSALWDTQGAVSSDSCTHRYVSRAESFP